ncbi:hypothetical protein [Sulfurovum riftiae]|uniref:Uncharacterized protein n=1 Tax=Sulfurovum riftiae TaxID=1630136 RepID=A0A151CJB6_9BACT|nr:hypothetical protein [Sulfurovum riftiae]KYJ87524.1 hypothetical protein AS592_10480 [Sulfurovum riftiae]
MAMTEMEKWQRFNERTKRASTKVKQRRQEIQDLKNAGVWQDPRTLYLDEDGYVLPNAPQWWLNLRRAWDVNDRRYAAQKAARPLNEGEPSQVPKRKKRYSKPHRKPKLKHSEKMKLLLEDHGLHVGDNGMLSDEFHEWQFCPNGRLKRNDKPTISVFYFLQHYADT